MPRKTGNRNSQAWVKSSPVPLSRLAASVDLTPPRALPVVAVPPLVQYIRNQLDYLGAKGSHLRLRVTNYASSILARVFRLPVLSRNQRITPLVTWQRVLDFAWVRQLGSRPLRKSHGKKYNTETFTALDDSNSVEKELLPPLGDRGLPCIADSLPHQPHSSTMQLLPVTPEHRALPRTGSKLPHQAGTSIYLHVPRLTDNRIPYLALTLSRSVGVIFPHPSLIPPGEWRTPQVTAGFPHQADISGDTSQPLSGKGLSHTTHSIPNHAAFADFPFSPSGSRRLPYSEESFPHRPDATSRYSPVMKALKEAEPVPDENSLPLKIKGRLSRLYEVSKILRPSEYSGDTESASGQQQVKHAYQSRWSDRRLPAFIQRLLQHRSSTAPSFQSSRQDMPVSYAFTEMERAPTSPPVRLVDKTRSRLAHQRAPSGTSGEPEDATSVNEIVQAVDDFGQVSRESQQNLSLYSPESTGLNETRTEASQVGSDLIPKSSFEAGSRPHILKSSIPTKKLNPALPTSRRTVRIGESSQARYSLPSFGPVNQQVQIAEKREKATAVPQELFGMLQGSLAISDERLDKVSYGKAKEAKQTELPGKEEPEYPASRYSEELSKTQSIHRMMNLPRQPGFKSVVSACSSDRPDRIEGYSLLRGQDLQSSWDSLETTRQPGMKAFLAPAAGATTGYSTTQNQKALPAMSSAAAYYHNLPQQLELELARIPVQRVESPSPTSPTREAKTTEGAKKETAPDIDSIARDVYRILKHRLARERERALGIS